MLLETLLQVAEQKTKYFETEMVLYHSKQLSLWNLMEEVEEERLDSRMAREMIYRRLQERVE